MKWLDCSHCWSIWWMHYCQILRRRAIMLNESTHRKLCSMYAAFFEVVSGEIMLNMMQMCILRKTTWHLPFKWRSQRHAPLTSNNIVIVNNTTICDIRWHQMGVVAISIRIRWLSTLTHMRVYTHKWYHHRLDPLGFDGKCPGNHG